MIKTAELERVIQEIRDVLPMDNGEFIELEWLNSKEKCIALIQNLEENTISFYKNICYLILKKYWPMGSERQYQKVLQEYFDKEKENDETI